jgi:hypothetical protein
MADLLGTAFNIGEINVTGLPIIQLIHFIIAAQSVPAGTIVPEGATIGVQVTTISNLPLATIDHTLPQEIGSMKVDDLNKMIAAQPNLVLLASDPAVLTDAAKRSEFLTAANAAAGRQLANEGNAEAMMRVIKLIRRR